MAEEVVFHGGSFRIATGLAFQATLLSLVLPDDRRAELARTAEAGIAA